jgi:hypothetical protein
MMVDEVLAAFRAARDGLAGSGTMNPDALEDSACRTVLCASALVPCHRWPVFLDVNWRHHIAEQERAFRRYAELPAVILHLFLVYA